MHPRIVKVLAILFVIVIVLAGSLYLADHVSGNEEIRQFVERFGYFGMLLLAIVSGLNLFVVPVPAATFTPVFVAAGFSTFAITTTLVIGTVIADTTGYLIGLIGKHVATLKYPKFRTRLKRFTKNHHRLVLPIVFLFAAFVPLPNEIVLIPLAVVGIRLRMLILPLLLGVIVNQTILVHGAAGIFRYFF